MRSLSLSVCVFVSVCLSVCLCVCLCLCLSVCLCVLFTVKAHSHQAHLRPSTRVYARRCATRRTSTRVYADMEHNAKKHARSHQARLRPSTDVNVLKIEPCSILSAFTSIDVRHGCQRTSTSDHTC